MLTLLVLLFDGRPDLPRAYSRLVFDLLSVCSKARLARSSSTYVAGTVAPDFVVYATTTSLKNRYYVAPSIVLLRSTCTTY